MRFLNEPCRARAARAAAGVAAVALVWGVALPTAQAQTGLLNDTGQTSCYDDSYNNTAVDCDEATTGNAGTGPHQDGRYGRDAAQAASVLPAKTGGGAVGFDFTKIANDGTDIAASAALGTAATEWACTRDNVTGLVWEVKTTSGLRSSEHKYSWYFTSDNGGNAGSVGANYCGSTLLAAPYNNQCNTSNYIAAVNAAGLCGATDWRLPTRRELLGIVHNGLTTGPKVDATYLPNTLPTYPGSSQYWSRDTSAPDTAKAWRVGFDDGYTYAVSKSNNYFVRLVRSGQ